MFGIPGKDKVNELEASIRKEVAAMAARQEEQLRLLTSMLNVLKSINEKMEIMIHLLEGGAQK